VAVYQFVELLEDELLHRPLVREVQELKTAILADPHARPPSASGLSRYVRPDPRDGARLPPELATLAVGLHEHIPLREHTYYVAVDKVGSTRLYILLDTERVETIEDGGVSV